MATLE